MSVKNTLFPNPILLVISFSVSRKAPPPAKTKLVFGNFLSTLSYAYKIVGRFFSGPTRDKFNKRVWSLGILNLFLRFAAGALSKTSLSTPEETTDIGTLTPFPTKYSLILSVGAITASVLLAYRMALLSTSSIRIFLGSILGR